FFFLQEEGGIRFFCLSGGLGDVYRRRGVDLYWTRHKRLPASLEELTAEPGTGAKRADPVTNQPYEYRTRGGNAYELCAAFDRESTSGQQHYYYRNFWAHGAGRQCFSLEAQEIKR
nr:hypothetical protein [Candidatus Omnitrophota bacterium]